MNQSMGSQVTGSIAQINLPQIIQDWLKLQGYSDANQIQQLLSPSLQSLRSPFLLKDLQKSIERLIAAYLNRETIGVYADFDLDGTSGLALLHEGLLRLGFQSVLPYQPLRLSQGYGLHASGIKALHEQGASVVISIDVGITGFEAATCARELEVDLIITDHHLPKETLPQAFSIVNPNQKECDSGLGHLSGCGVAFYLLMGLRNIMGAKGLLTPEAAAFSPKEILDCFCIGTLTDLVPLHSENRVLVKHGMHQLTKTRRMGLQVLMEHLQLHRKNISSKDVVLSLAPKLNALSRMELGLRPIDLFLVKDRGAAEEMVTTVLDQNQMRRDLQSEATENAIRMLNIPEGENPPAVFVWSESFHKGVIGLVATQLSQKFQCPAFVASAVGEGVLVGSCRLPESLAPTCSLVEILTVCSDYLTGYGGHRQAAGFQLKEEAAESFRQALILEMTRKIAESQSKEHVEDILVDRLVQGLSENSFMRVSSLAVLNETLMSWIERLEPFGKEFPYPQFLVENLKITDVKQMKGGHLRMKLQQNLCEREAVFFSPGAEKRELLLGDSFKQGDFLLEIAWNEFRGVRRLQFLVKGLEFTSQPWEIKDHDRRKEANRESEENRSTRDPSLL